MYRTRDASAIPSRELRRQARGGTLVDMSHEDHITDKYISLWNEPDHERRRQLIRELWTEDGSQVLEPPQEMLAAANTIGFRSPRLESRGYEQLEERVKRAYDEFVGSGQYRFRRRDNVSRLDHVLKFGWEMVPTDSDEAVAVGLEIMMLVPDGRIRTDYQFIEQ